LAQLGREAVLDAAYLKGQSFQFAQSPVGFGFVVNFVLQRLLYVLGGHGMEIDDFEKFSL
jgi:hypothetical protein